MDRRTQIYDNKKKNQIIYYDNNILVCVPLAAAMEH